MSAFFPWIVAAALAFGAALGAKGLLDPGWAARIVRLAPHPDMPGGQAEFRAAYGGMYLATHGAALVLMGLWLGGVDWVAGAPTRGVAIGVVSACALGWAGNAVGRSLAVLRDGADTPYNRFSIALEAGMALALCLVWLA